jgi:hypothetical protein
MLEVVRGISHGTPDSQGHTATTRHGWFLPFHYPFTEEFTEGGEADFRSGKSDWQCPGEVQLAHRWGLPTAYPRCQQETRRQMARGNGWPSSPSSHGPTLRAPGQTPEKGAPSDPDNLGSTSQSPLSTRH